MPHVFTPAPTGRAKCRGCGQPIEKATLRFGESIPNPFAEGETTLWFHPLCAAYRRPEPLIETLESPDLPAGTVPDREDLLRAARASAAHRRLPRINGAEPAPTGQAKCRSCHEPIARGVWRVRLVFYEEGRFVAAGFVHLSCRGAYFETDDIMAPLLHFSPALSEQQREELARACQS